MHVNISAAAAQMCVAFIHTCMMDPWRCCFMRELSPAISSVILPLRAICHDSACQRLPEEQSCILDHFLRTTSGGPLLVADILAVQHQQCISALVRDSHCPTGHLVEALHHHVGHARLFGSHVSAAAVSARNISARMDGRRGACSVRCARPWAYAAQLSRET